MATIYISYQYMEFLMKLGVKQITIKLYDYIKRVGKTWGKPGPFDYTHILAWLEKQGNLMKALQISNSRIGELIEKNYYLKEQLEKQGKQNLADEVKPKFKVGDWVVNTITKEVEQIIELTDTEYICSGHLIISFTDDGLLKRWTIQDAKDGDVLATKAGGIFIYKELLYNKPFAYCGVDKFGVFKDCNCGDGLDWTPYLSNVTPATKEQRDLLFQKMKEAGYEWDAEKNELKKVEQKPDNDLPKGEDYGIDGLWHAERILEKTLGEVKG